MSFSLNEIEAMSKKAARGSGLSWGIAEEAGKAVRWLASHNLPGARALVDLLALNETAAGRTAAPMALENLWAAPNGATLCPLRTGAALSDCADQLPEQPIALGQIAYPVLLAPFAAWAAVHLGKPVCVSWGTTRIQSDGVGLRIDDPDTTLTVPSVAQVSCSQADDITANFTQPTQRGSVDAKTWNQLNEFAHRTYAPATEASRMLGAGAGVSDND